MITQFPSWMNNLLPIVLLLAAVAIVFARLPKIELGHSKAFLQRRFLNWFPLGLTYAFLYMGRYNLTVSKNALGELMTKSQFGTIFFWGTLTYGCAFVLNGPLTDRIGGRKAMLIAAAGSSAMNMLLGVATYLLLTKQLDVANAVVPIFSIIYSANMYFQSFGAVSVVKVNAHWFHVRERGTFGGIFGILISLGIYFAFDWGKLIVDNAPTWWVFFVPAIALAIFWVIDKLLVRDTPSATGHLDFDCADASSGDTGPQLGVLRVAKLMLSNRVIVIIALVEFCSGFLRNAVMHWYIIFANQTGMKDHFVPQNWGLLLCLAGIMSGVIAGIISDRVFDSRRGPVASVLYMTALLASVAACFFLATPALGWLVIVLSLCIIGVHGMLSGTASMDFGGRKNVGVAVGIIDGLVYLGTAAQALVLGEILPEGEAQKDPSNWAAWPLSFVPIALIGLVLATRVWNARPAPRASAAPAQPTAAAAAVAQPAAIAGATPAMES
jgi:MFS transporter, OPA family, glycerol-3-phosphate transporter